MSGSIIYHQRNTRKGLGRETPPRQKGIVKVNQPPPLPPKPPKRINVATQDTSDEEEEAVAISDDKGSH